MENLEKKEGEVEEKKCCGMLKNKKVWIPGLIVLIILIVIGGILIFNKPQEEVEVVVVDDKQEPVGDYAGKMYLESMVNEVKVGDEIVANVLLDTLGTNIVAVNIRLNYDKSKWEVVEVDSENSVLSIGAIENKEDGYVEIVRGEPGDNNVDDSDDGYTGSDGILSSVVLRALESGEARVWLDNQETQVAVDDGQATLMNLDLMDLNFLIN